MEDNGRLNFRVNNMGKFSSSMIGVGLWIQNNGFFGRKCIVKRYTAVYPTLLLQQITFHAHYL